MELIKTLNLPRTLVDDLNPFVQDKFNQLWKATQPLSNRYIKLWKNQQSSNDEQSAAEALKAMLAEGITLEPASGSSNEFAHLVTTDPDIAKKYDMHDETEFLDEDE